MYMNGATIFLREDFRERAGFWVLALTSKLDERGDRMGETLSQPNARRLRNRDSSNL
jgi:hypothetical protein